MAIDQRLDEQQNQKEEGDSYLRENALITKKENMLERSDSNGGG
jgi:hypothetical protein